MADKMLNVYEIRKYAKCPKCGAEKGEKCINENGEIHKRGMSVRNHLERLSAARETTALGNWINTHKK